MPDDGTAKNRLQFKLRHYPTGRPFLHLDGGSRGPFKLQAGAPATCQNGAGTCSDWFYVQAQPATPGRNNFIVPNPNKTCALLGF